MFTVSIAAESFDELRAHVSQLNAQLNDPATDLHQAVRDNLTAPTGGMSTVAPVAPVPVANTVTAPAAPAPAVPPTAPAPTYRLEDLSRACCQLTDAGRSKELEGLFEQYGIKGKGLSAIPAGQYGAFATSLRSLGVVI